MIELVPSLAAGSDLQFLLRPRRALTGRQFAGLFGVLAGAMWLVALVTFGQGNVFAPAFALLDSVLVALALRWAWRRGERFELIAWSERSLEVRRSTQPEPAFQAHPYWVRLWVTQEHGEARVHLGSRGQTVEVGGFLADEERRDLARRLQELLASANGPRPITDHSSR